MDLAKASDTINHDLLIAKSEAYGFSKWILLFMLSYLKSKSQHLGEKYSTREKIIVGVLQGSILGSLLFNIFVNDIFHLENRSFFFIFTDDNDLYPFGINAEEGKQNLIQDHLKLSEW